jgi:predicted ATP-grasp superfamily ATP-dependent carboligase
MCQPQRVLVLDGETTQALAAVRSLGRAGHTLFVASDQRRPLAAWSRHCHARYRIPALSLDAFADLRQWAIARGINVVLPLTERTCTLLNLDAAQWAAAGIVLGCGPTEMLRPAFDKAETFRRAAACGVSIPATYFPDSVEGFREAAAALARPWVIKSRFSNSWQRNRFLPDLGVAYVDRLADLDAAVEARRQGPEGWPIIQEYVRGQGKGVFALCDHGEVVLWFAHERLRDVRPSGSGSSLRRSVALDPRLRDVSERFLRALSWHGPAMLEFRDDGERTPWFIEMNGRFWGSLQLAVSAGVDFPARWLDILLGASIPSPAPAYREGVVLRWMWGDVKRLFHLLHGAPRGFPEPYPAVMRGVVDLLGPQPRGTRHETWDRADPWPVVAEWLQGISTELVPRLVGAHRNTPRVGDGVS